MRNEEDRAKKLGIISSDLAKGERLMESLKGADRNQVTVMIEGRSLTFDRNSVQIEVEKAIDAISSRGELHFMDDLSVEGRFHALVASSGKEVEDQEPEEGGVSASARGGRIYP